jgi:hypothetical protein
MAWPGVLELGVAPDCAKDSVVPYRKTPASKSMQLGPKLSFTGASSASHFGSAAMPGENMLFLSAIPGNPYLRSALWVSKGRSVLQSSREQQKWASAPHLRPKDFSLQV